MKIFSKIIKMIKVIKSIEILKTIKDFHKFKGLGVTFKEAVLLNIKNRKKNKSILFGKEIKITDSFWHLHSLTELFIEEVYRFNTDNENLKIIDCGSNIGLSIIYFKRLYPNSKIIGFEPDDDIFKMMQFNLNQFKFNDVEIFQKAVWVNNKPILFCKNGSLGGHLTDERKQNSIKIQTARLREFLNEKVDFLKIDIEGSEYEIIKDCMEVLCNVENIFIEYHSFHENPQMIGELLIILKYAGFKIYIKEAWENMKYPFIEKKGPYFDLQLNISGYRR
jgi:FkbM family methyltransferase